MNAEYADLLQPITESAVAANDLPKSGRKPKFIGDNQGTKDAALGEGSDADTALGLAPNEGDLGSDDDIEALDEQALLQFANAQEAVADQLNEGVNIVRLNRQTRLNNLSHRTALVLARRANDPLFAKYAKFNALRLKFRAAIVKKYGPRATSYARKIMNKTSVKK